MSETKNIETPALRAAFVPAEGRIGAEAEALPSRMKILSWGDNPNSRGLRVHVGEKLVAAMAAPTYPFDRVALDFEHNTVPGTAEWKNSAEPRPVAAFAAVEAVPGDGVYLARIDWTREGREAAHLYRDLSATPVLDEAGEVIAVASAALVRAGAVPGIAFTEAPPVPEKIARTLSALAADLPQPYEPKPKTPKNPITMDYRKALIEALGLAEDAADEQIAEALAAALAAKKTEDEAPEAAAENPEGGLAALSARVDAMEKQAILTEARMAGKAVALSADAVAALTPEQLRETVEATPATVPLSARTPEAVRETPAKSDPSELALHVYGLCGMKPEEVEKWA